MDQSTTAATASFETEPTESRKSEPTVGYEYVVRAGDSLASIAQDFARAGVSVTPDNILQANPGLDPARLKIGQRLFVPAEVP